MLAPSVIHASDIPTLQPAQVIELMRRTFSSLAHGRALQPEQSVLPLDRGGDVIIYPSLNLDEHTYAVKVSPYIPTSSGLPPTVTAWTLLLNTQTGIPIALIDAKALTTLRTAATSALAVDLLAAHDASTLSVVGGGPMARAHLDYLRATRPFTTVTLHSRSTPTFDPGDVTVTSDIESAARSDVIALCTSASSPVIDARTARSGSVITSVSTNAPGAHEIAPTALADLEVYVDHRPSERSVAEFQLAAQLGWDPESVRGDLPELLTSRAMRPSGTAPVFFRSLGLGLEDHAIASAVIQALRDRNTVDR